MNILLNYVTYNKLRCIILKLEIKLIEIIIKNTVNKILRIKTESRVLNTEYKKLTYKEI